MTLGLEKQWKDLTILRSRSDGFDICYELSTGGQGRKERNWNTGSSNYELAQRREL